MKASKIFWGLGFILAAVLILLNALGVISPFFDFVGGVSAAAIIFGLLLVSLIISEIVKLRFSLIPYFLAFLFMTFEKNIAVIAGLGNTDIVNNWLVFGCAVLVSIGVSIIIPDSIRLRRRFKLTKDTKASFGSTVRYIDCNDFVEEFAYNRMGEYVIHFKNTESFASGATLTVKNNMGQTVVNVPSEWNAAVDIANSLGSVTQKGTGNPEGPTLIINGENSLGEVLIKYV